MKATQHTFDTVSVIKIDELPINIEKGSLVVTEKDPSADSRLTSNPMIGYWVLNFIETTPTELPDEAILSFQYEDFQETILNITKLRDGKSWATPKATTALSDAIRRLNNSSKTS